MAWMKLYVEPAMFEKRFYKLRWQQKMDYLYTTGCPKNVSAFNQPQSKSLLLNKTFFCSWVKCVKSILWILIQFSTQI